MTQPIRTLEEFAYEVVSIMDSNNITSKLAIQMRPGVENSTQCPITSEKSSDYELNYAAYVPEGFDPKSGRTTLESEIQYQEKFSDPKEGVRIVADRFNTLQALLIQAYVEIFRKDTLAIDKKWGYNIEIYDAGPRQQELFPK